MLVIWVCVRKPHALPQVGFSVNWGRTHLWVVHCVAGFDPQTEMSVTAKEYMGIIAQMPCALCGDRPVHVHHIREGQGMAQRASDFLTIPLCPSCHTSSVGVHGDKTMLRIMKKSELDLLADTIQASHKMRQMSQL